MTSTEFRHQVFRTPEHWTHPCGLGYTLQALAGGGVALFSRPAFDGWTTQAEEALGASSFAVDGCDRVFWIHRHDCHLYRRDPVNDLVERMMPLPDCAADAQDFGRVLSADRRIWIADRLRSRLIAVRPDTFEIIRVTPVTHLVDLAYANGRLFSLSSDGIREHGLTGEIVAGPFSGPIGVPVALGADGGARRLYVVDDRTRGFLCFSADECAFERVIGNFDVIARDFAPWLLIVHPDGNLFVSDGSRLAHEFAPDGGYVGPMGELSPLGEILGMAVGPNGGIHVGSRSGIARFGREPGIAGHSGQFYTRTLDNGSDQSDGWQRVDLVAEIDGGGAIDLYYASEQDPGLAAAVSGVFERSQSTKEKADALESMLQDRWIGPHALRASATADASARAHNAFGAPITHSVALRADAKRFLWLKLEFSSLTPRARASVREMRVYYPRLSYLRYLPALYQQDPISRDFLERFLSMFETVFGGLEATVERIPETLDAARAPIEFLDWLARWLDLAMEEDWPAAVKRRLVQKAARLYERKGTPAGLAEFIEVVTGGRAVIRESFATDKPFILGDGTLLGIDSRVSRAAVVDLPASQRTVLGQKSFLGSSELRSTTQARTDPFRSSAFRFTIWLDLPLARFRRYERGLHGIIRDNAPAHLSYDIRLVPRASLGSSTILGVNFRVTNPPPLHLGYATLGESVCVRDVLYGPELGVNRASPDLHEGPDGTSAWSDGER